MEKGAQFPAIWGHVLGTTTRLQGLTPGTQILFHRFSEERILEVPSLEPLFPGEMLDVSLLHFDAIEAVFSPNLVEMRT